jgi:uncharacterized repeat protein (TIGR02543 family)
LSKTLFYNCTALKTIVLPQSVTVINDSTFYNCTALESIALDHITAIGNSAFRGCANLKLAPTSLQNLNTLGPSAFRECKALTSIVLPDALTKLDTYVFYTCSALNSVTLPSTLTEIGNYAFYNTAFTSISLPESLSTIGSNAFQYAKLTEIEFPSSLKTLSASAFADCASLTSVEIPTGLTTFGTNVFQACSALTTVVIPEGYTEIPDSTFRQCTVLKSIDLPSSIKRIGTYAFSASGLTGISLPEGVTTIDTYAFYSAPLAAIDLPSTLNTIGDSVFRTCKVLKSIEIPSSVTAIGNNAFQDATALRRISIPAAVRTVGTNVFNGCTSLEHLYFLGAPPTFGNANAFTNVGSDAIVYYPPAYGAQWQAVESALLPLQDKRPFITAIADLGYDGKKGTVYAGGTAGGEVFTVIKPLDPTREGYEFAGWYGDATYNAPFDFTITITATDTVTLFAKWIDLSEDTEIGNFQLVREWIDERAFYSFTVASDGTVYTGMGSTIRAFDVEGREKTGFGADLADTDINTGGTNNARMCMLTIDGREYLAVVNGLANITLFILNAQTGALVWKADLGDKIEGLPAADSNGNIYVVAGRVLYALNMNAEKYLWKAPLGSGDNFNMPFFAFYGNDRIFLEIDQEIWGFDSAGNQLWHNAGPVVTDNVFARSHELLVNPQDGTVYWSVPQRRLDALNPDTGVAAWSLNANQNPAQYPLYNIDNSKLLMNIDNKLTEIDPSTGAVGGSYAPAGGYGVWNGGYLYTDTNIYNAELRVVATYAEPNEDAGRSDFHLGENGDLYRAIGGALVWQTTALEKVRLVENTGDTDVSDIRLSVPERNLFPSGQTNVKAVARNASGILLTEQALEWESSNADIAEVSYVGNGAAATVQAKQRYGETTITVKATDTNVTQSFTVTVQEEPKPTEMYFFLDTGSALTDAPPRIDRVETYAYKAIPHIRIYVKDQYGNFYGNMPVDWETPNISSDFYQDGSDVYEIKYGVLLRPKTPTETYVKATARDYPELQCQIPVTINPPQVRKVWSIDPAYEQIDKAFNTYFALNDDKSAIYMTANGILSCLDAANGTTMWNLYHTEGGNRIYFSAPKIGADANIYLTETYNDHEARADRRMYKVSPQGNLLAQSDWTKYIKDLVPDGSYNYMLTVDDEIYYVDDNLSLVWGQPVSPGSGELRGALVYGDSLYIARGDSVYKIRRDGTTELLYRDDRVNFSLEGMDSDGNLLLQRNTLGHFRLVFLSLSGETLWSRALDTQAAVTMTNDGIYAVECGAGIEKHLHVLDKNGDERLHTTFEDRNANEVVGLTVGPDGIVYIATSQLNALSPVGELLWQFPTRPDESYFPYTAPLQVLSVANNTLISSSGQGPLGGGIMVSQGIPQNGIDVHITGDDATKPDAFKDLRIEITNYQDTMDVTLEIILEDAAMGKAISKTVFEDTLAAGKSSTYSCGIKIPSSGDLQLVVSIRNTGQQVLYSKEITVQQ